MDRKNCSEFLHKFSLISVPQLSAIQIRNIYMTNKIWVLYEGSLAGMHSV